MLKKLPPNCQGNRNVKQCVPIPLTDIPLTVQLWLAVTGPARTDGWGNMWGASEPARHLLNLHQQAKALNLKLVPA